MQGGIWEDLAESWAHYLHMIDTLETSAAFGLRVHPRIRRGRELAAAIDFDPYRPEDFDADRSLDPPHIRGELA
jgi:hypothetical protein